MPCSEFWPNLGSSRPSPTHKEKMQCIVHETGNMLKSVFQFGEAVQKPRIPGMLGIPPAIWAEPAVKYIKSSEVFDLKLVGEAATQFPRRKQMEL
jgi:hypothetical protein